jgi:hypothetical protein
MDTMERRIAKLRDECEPSMIDGTQLATLRHELDTLKVALEGAADADERLQIRARINACLRAYLQLVNARLQAALTSPHP